MIHALSRRILALSLAALAAGARAQDNQLPADPEEPPTTAPRRPTFHTPSKVRERQDEEDAPARKPPTAQPPHRVPITPPGFRPGETARPVRNAPAAPSPAAEKPAAAKPTAETEPPESAPVDKKVVAKNARTVVMSFDKRDLSEVIQFVSQFTQRNFILPERVSGKITILSNSPIPADEVWNVFVAALDANNWSVYPVGRYWKLIEKKQSSRANIPTFIEPGQESPGTEQMVTKLFKLRYVEADQMRNVLNQFTSRDSDFQIFPPDTLVISDLGLNMRRLERLIEQLDQPGGSEEIHIVPVQYAGAQELAQKLTEIFQAQGQKPGASRGIGLVGEPIQPGQPPPPPGAPATGAAQGGGPVTVNKILSEERTNKLIVIASGRAFTRVLELIRQLDVPAGEGGVHVYYLENAKAEEIAATLQNLAQGGGRHRTGTTAPTPVPAAVPAGGAAQGPIGADLFSGEVKITADKNTNSLVVIASQADYRNFIKVVQKLDIRRRQVFVEAVIMEVNLQNDLDVGVSAHGGTIVDNVSFRGAKGSAPVVVGSELGGLNSIGGVASLGTLGGFLAGIQGPPITVPGTSLTLPSFAILLNALQSSSDVNVISTPHVIMTDNTEGEITVGQNVPFQAGYSPQLAGLGSIATGATGTPGTTTPAVSSLLGLGGLGSLYAPIQRQNVELRLRIKPQINESDYVRLEVDEQTEEIASVDKQLGPTTSKRSAKTTVVAKDQETVVLGGLIQERAIKDVKKIPVLGSLPIVGWLFRNESTKKTRTNLLLFLTPYIIRDQSDYRRIFERKMSERAEFVKRFYGEESPYETPVDFDRKPGPLSRLRRGVDEEMDRIENGGPGAPDERVIGPSPRYTPPQMDHGGAVAPPSPKPLPPEPKAEPAPGVQEPPVSPPAPQGGGEQPAPPRR